MALSVRGNIKVKPNVENDWDKPQEAGDLRLTLKGYDNLWMFLKV